MIPPYKLITIILIADDYDDDNDKERGPKKITFLVVFLAVQPTAQ